MRAKRAIFLVVLAVTASSCAARQPVPTIVIDSCGPVAVGTHQLSIRRAAVVDSALLASRRGALSVRVSTDYYAPPRALKGAQVSLFRSAAADAANLIRSGLTDEAGWWSTDGLGAGQAYAQSRAIGFERLIELVAVRAGYRDTLEFQLRAAVLCHPGFGQ